MKTVFTNSEIVHAFNLQDQPHGRTSNGSMYFRDNKIYSYGSHYLLGEFIDDETIIIEDSVVGVNAGKSAKVKVIGLTAGGHWQKDRDEKELINAGAIASANNYNKIKQIIESL